MSRTGISTQPSLLDRIFDISLILKGLDGVLEIIGGVLLLLVSPKQLTGLVELLTQHELIQDPKDFLATHLLAYAHTLTAALTLFDCFIVYLTVLEYRKHLRLQRVSSHMGMAAQRTGKGKEDA